MNKIKPIFIVGMALVVVFLYSSCRKENNPVLQRSISSSDETTTDEKSGKKYYGHPVKVGCGTARAWVSENSCGEPLAVGIDLSAKALDGLPSHHTEYVLNFPHQASTDFYKHAVINWNPHGHVPSSIYDIPHFDFHFYTITNNQRMMIGANDSIQFANAPLPQYVPSSYLQAPGGEALMGAHWVDLLSPEFNGGAFTRTYVWGSYDGEFIFWEPMATRDYLLTHPNDNILLRQPQAFQHDGWYPKKYIVKYSTSPKQYTVALTDLKFRHGQ